MFQAGPQLTTLIWVHTAPRIFSSIRHKFRWSPASTSHVIIMKSLKSFMWTKLTQFILPSWSEDVQVHTYHQFKTEYLSLKSAICWFGILTNQNIHILLVLILFFFILKLKPHFLYIFGGTGFRLLVDKYFGYQAIRYNLSYFTMRYVTDLVNGDTRAFMGLKFVNIRIVNGLNYDIWFTNKLVGNQKYLPTYV